MLSIEVKIVLCLIAKNYKSRQLLFPPLPSSEMLRQFSMIEEQTTDNVYIRPRNYICVASTDNNQRSNPMGYPRNRQREPRKPDVKNANFHMPPNHSVNPMRLYMFQRSSTSSSTLSYESPKNLSHQPHRYPNTGRIPRSLFTASPPILCPRNTYNARSPVIASRRPGSSRTIAQLQTVASLLTQTLTNADRTDNRRRSRSPLNGNASTPTHIRDCDAIDCDYSPTASASTSTNVGCARHVFGLARGVVRRADLGVGESRRDVEKREVIIRDGGLRALSDLRYCSCRCRR